MRHWHYVLIGAFVSIFGGAFYLDQFVEEKPAWVASVASTITDNLLTVGSWLQDGLPDCADEQVQETVVELSQQLVYNALPYYVEMPFRIEQIVLGSVIERDGVAAETCEARLQAPLVGYSQRMFDVGIVEFTIDADVNQVGRYVVSVELVQTNF